jgi:hypothetical protein
MKLNRNKKGFGYYFEGLISLDAEISSVYIPMRMCSTISLSLSRIAILIRSYDKSSYLSSVL